MCFPILLQTCLFNAAFLDTSSLNVINHFKSRPWESLFSLEKPPKRMTFIRIHLQGVVLLLLRSVVHQQYTTPPGWLKSLRFFSSNFCYPKFIQEIISLMFCCGSLPPGDESRVISWWSGMGGMFCQLLAWHEDLATWYVKIWRQSLKIRGICRFIIQEWWLREA